MTDETTATATPVAHATAPQAVTKVETNTKPEPVADADPIKDVKAEKAADAKGAEPEVKKSTAPLAKEAPVADPDPVKDTKAEAAFPDNWREQLAGDNKALLNTLKRYASPKSWTDAAFALRQKISTGELKSTLPKDATPEQVAEYRKDLGIPEKPEDYDLTLPGGIVIGENDKPLVNEFLKEMHGSNATPDQVKSALTAYYKIEQNLIRETEAKDSDFKTESEDALRAEWGGDFKKNVNLVTGVLNTLPDEVADRIAFARTPEGRKLGDDPGFLRAMAQWARDMGIDSGVLMGNNAADALKSLESEKAGIEKVMNTKNYTPTMRERYAEIIDVLEKQKSRVA